MSTTTPEDEGPWVFCRYITKNGKRIYPRNGTHFRFRAKPRRK